MKKQTKNDTPFENNLQDILEPDDCISDSVQRFDAQNSTDDCSAKKKVAKDANSFPKIVPAWMEKSIRIVAGILAFIFLIIFANQIASR